MSELHIEGLVIILTLVAVLASFTLSASAGLGGSLLLVPALALVMGSKEGVALAALLLGGNNVFKVAAYRATLPWRASGGVVLLISLGAGFGATLLAGSPDGVVGVAIVAALLLSLVAERRGWMMPRRIGSRVLAFASGALSGFSGTSGPLKGAAIRNLDLDRLHFVGAASLASLAGDLVKAGIFAEAALLGRSSVLLLLAAVPLMAIGTYIGRSFNRRVGEKGFALFFWAVMTGYTVRLVVVLG